MVAYHPRRYVSSWLIAKAMPPYETYAAPGGRRLTVWRAERRSSPAGPRLGRAPLQSTSSLVAMVSTACTPVPKASSQTGRGAEIRSGSPAVSAASSPRPASLATPLKPPHPQVLPRDKEGVVRRLAVRPAASPFFGEGVEGRGERGAGLVGGTWISAPWFWASLGELVDAVAPSVAPAIADVLAALPGPGRRGNAAGAGLSSKGSHSTSINPSYSAS